MANISDVFLKIKYRKNGKIQEDDLLNDDDLLDIFYDMSYLTPYYTDKEKNIIRAYGRWNYSGLFYDNKLFQEFLDMAKSKGIENIYFIFIENEDLLCWAAFKMYDADIKNNIIFGRENVITDNDGKYYEMFKDIFSDKVRSNLFKPREDGEIENFEQQTEEKIKFLYEKFLDFLDKIEKIFKIEDEDLWEEEFEKVFKNYEGKYDIYKNGNKVTKIEETLFQKIIKIFKKS